jgi:hypothetical protein
MKIIGLLLRKNICSFIFFSSLIVCLIRYFTIASCTGNQILSTTGVINQFCIITSATTSIYNKFPYQYSWSSSPICAGFPSTTMNYPEGTCLQDTTGGSLAYDSYYTSFLNGTASSYDNIIFSTVPTTNPSVLPTVVLTVMPTVVATTVPTSLPTITNPPSLCPSNGPSPSPSTVPTIPTISGGTLSPSLTRAPTASLLSPTMAPVASHAPTINHIPTNDGHAPLSSISLLPTMNNNSSSFNSTSPSSSASSSPFAGVGGTGGLSGIIIGGVALLGLFYCYHRNSSIHRIQPETMNQGQE